MRFFLPYTSINKLSSPANIPCAVFRVYQAACCRCCSLISVCARSGAVFGNFRWERRQLQQLQQQQQQSQLQHTKQQQPPLHPLFRQLVVQLCVQFESYLCQWQMIRIYRKVAICQMPRCERVSETATDSERGRGTQRSQSETER